MERNQQAAPSLQSKRRVSKQGEHQQRVLSTLIGSKSNTSRENTSSTCLSKSSTKTSILRPKPTNQVLNDSTRRFKKVLAGLIQQPHIDYNNCKCAPALSANQVSQQTSATFSHKSPAFSHYLSQLFLTCCSHQLGCDDRLVSPWS